MNTNGQILDQANKIINSIRIHKDAIEQLQHVSSGMSGGTQKSIILSAGGSQIDLSFSNRSYAQELRKPYSLCLTFLRKGIQIEIEVHQKIVKDFTEKLNNLTFSV